MRFKIYSFVLPAFLVATTSVIAAQNGGPVQTRSGLTSARTFHLIRVAAKSKPKAKPVFRPVTKSKTVLTQFQTSPFPYQGLAPKAATPFFDVLEGERRGHTSGRGGAVYWEDATYSDRRVLMHIPKGFNPNLPSALIVYLHGNRARLDRDVRDRQQVPQQVTESGINAVLVAPQFAVDASDSAPVDLARLEFLRNSCGRPKQSLPVFTAPMRRHRCLPQCRL